MNMELQHRLVRQAIDIAVSKAIDDMKSDAKRSIRNLIDLGLLFSKSENQKHFFNAAQEVISNPRNAYHSLAARTIADVNNDTIKKTGLNLGYSSLIYGANKLRKRQEFSDDPLPWLLIFEIYDSGSESFDQMKQFIAEGRELGIYSYIICPHKTKDVVTICEVAKCFDDCLFALSVSSALISDRSAGVIGDTHNMMVSVKVSGSDFCSKNDENVFRMLKQNRCLFGFHTVYNDANMEQVTSSDYIHSAIGHGNTFGIYIPDEGVSDRCKAAMYEFACGVRGINGQPLIAIEWVQDMQYISERILSGDGYLKMNLTEIVYGEYRKAKDALTDSLLETLKVLKRLRPCTSS
jgi:hypothetical protein